MATNSEGNFCWNECEWLWLILLMRGAMLYACVIYRTLSYHTSAYIRNLTLHTQAMSCRTIELLLQTGIHTIYFFPCLFRRSISFALVCIVCNLTELSAHELVLPTLLCAEHLLNKIYFDACISIFHLDIFPVHFIRSKYSIWIATGQPGDGLRYLPSKERPQLDRCEIFRQQYLAGKIPQCAGRRVTRFSIESR